MFHFNKLEAFQMQVNISLVKNPENLINLPSTIVEMSVSNMLVILFAPIININKDLFN